MPPARHQHAITPPSPRPAEPPTTVADPPGSPAVPPGRAADPPASADAPTPAPGPAPPSRREMLRSVGRKFSADQCTDMAAALTYYAVLALFPALVALVGVVGKDQQTVDGLLTVLRTVGGTAVADAVREPIQELVGTPTAGLGLLLGLLGALWSASGFVGAFGRALNRVYDIPEGRPYWKLRPAMLLVTLVGVVLVAVVGVALVLTGPVARAVGQWWGIDRTALAVWEIAKWPAVLAVVVLVVALLYWATPNVRRSRPRWLSPGAGLAIAVWVLASVGFGFYVANVAGYNETYGSLAGVVVFLLWVWLTNLALLFGAEIDAELARTRQLRAGLAAEEHLVVDARDTRASDKAAEVRRRCVERDRALREACTGQD